MRNFIKVRSTIAASGFIGMCIKPCINNVPSQKAQTLVVQHLCLFTIRPNFMFGDIFHLNVVNCINLARPLNKQVKTKQVTDNSLLYKLKHDALAKLLQENKANKLYLHKYSRKIIFIVVKCENYLFHHPASETDLKELEYKEVVFNHRIPPTKNHESNTISNACLTSCLN